MAVNEILASVDDINTHLPVDKLDADDDTMELDINRYETDTVRLVRGMLSGTFTAVTLASWTNPAATPDQIRQVAGRLIAAKYYSVRYAEDADISEYAQGLYNEAMAMLRDIRSGSLIVLDSNDIPIVTAETPGVTTDDVWSSRTTTTGPKFTMDKEFA